MLTACSGEAEQDDGPRLPEPVATDLAQRSDQVADLLAAGDVCGAAVAADELRTATTDAINRGSVPAPFQEELSGAVNGLVNEVNCPPPAEEEDKEEEDKGKGKDKDKEEKEGE